MLRIAHYVMFEEFGPVLGNFHYIMNVRCVKLQFVQP